MLRAKQLGTLSQCARSFYLSGSRCGSADGASCTCPDDDAGCGSKRQTTSGIEQKFQSPHRSSLKGQPPPAQHIVGSIGGATGPQAAHVVPSTSAPEKDVASSNRSNPPSNHQVLGNGYVQPSSQQTARTISQSGIAGAGVYTELVRSSSNNRSINKQAPQAAGDNYSSKPTLSGGQQSSNNKAPHIQHSYAEVNVQNDFGKGASSRSGGYAKSKQSFSSGPSAAVLSSSSSSPSQVVRNQRHPGHQGQADHHQSNSSPNSELQHSEGLILMFGNLLVFENNVEIVHSHSELAVRMIL